MKIYKQNGFYFARLTESQKDLLDGLTIGRYVIEKEEIDFVREILGLEDLSTELELRAIRNSVVRHYDSYDDIYDEVEMQKMNNMSGVVSVIDARLFEVGCIV